MDRANDAKGEVKKNSEHLAISDGPKLQNDAHEDHTKIEENKTRVVKKYRSKHMKMYPELYRSDVSIHPSYTGLKNLPYYVICRKRAQKRKKQIMRQINREITHIAMMQNYALAGVMIDRIFSIGFPPEATNVQDFATIEQRRRINQLLSDR